ncbi:MAG: hypothetical protein ABI693_03420 [Bryobacteraceae bacterium]
MARFISNLTQAVATVALCAAVPFAYADTVNMTLTSAGNVVLGGVYVNPYTANINGVSSKIICDDFAAETWVNESWSANVTTIDQLGGTKWGSVYADATQRYNASAWLINRLLSAANATELGQVSFAIWGVFTPSALNTLSTTDRNAAQGLINQAMGNTYAAGTFSNFAIFTPIAGSATNCGGGPCAAAPQEFMGIRKVVRADEASSTALLGLNLLALIGFGLLYRRRMVGLS